MTEIIPRFGDRPAGPVLVIIAALALGGCAPPAADDRVLELRRAVETTRASLRTGDGGDPRVRDALDRYHEIAAKACGTDRRAAAQDSLLAVWRREPAGVLWPELASLFRHRFPEPARLDSLFDQAGFPDSSTALGSFLREWRYSPRPDGSGYERARALRAELAPFDDVWLSIRLARHERRQGNAEAAIAEALRALPKTRETGGWRLEMKAWVQMAYALQAAGDLDGALHAAVLAEDLAEAVAEQTGNHYVLVDARRRRAEILGDRREIEPALALYASSAREARAHGLAEFTGMILNRAGIFTGAVGRYEEGLSFYHQALEYALADADSLNVPRHFANLGRRHCILGNLDSCRIYLEEAERWVRAYPDRSNLARLPLLLAEYHAQVGNFATVDSLHAVAAELTPKFSPIAERAELHLELIRQGTERGRPAQVYRSIAYLDSLRHRLQRSFADRNEVFDLDLATAEFLGRQGLFVRAEEALDRADATLALRPDPTRSWELAEARGHLARRRGDAGSAAAAYRECVSLSAELGDEDRRARSDLWLASLHLDQDDPPAALEVLSSDGASFEKRFRTRMSAALLRAHAETRRGRPEAALQELDRVRALSRPSSPPDLLVRLDLRTGRALASLGRVDAAREAYASARERLQRERSAIRTDDAVFFDRDVRRELAEAWLDLALSGTSEIRGPGAEKALREVASFLPAWQRPGGAPARALAEPQIVFFVGARASCRWTVRDGVTTLRRLPGEEEILRVMRPVLADLREPSRSPVAAEVASLTEALGGPVPTRSARDPLVVVPDGPLFAVPWAALVADGAADRTWLDRGPIVVADAPRDRAAAASGGSPDTLRLLALGADSGAGASAAGLDALRHAEREARDVCARWPPDRASLLVGEEVRGGMLLTARLAEYDVIHVSSHAKAYQGTADQTTLFVVGAGETPVTAAEIRDLDLRAELVFLSCCEAVDGVRRGVGPAHAGLARSFLDAGARHVIASGIRIDDEAARHFALRFYEHWLAGAPLGDALRRAQLDLRDGEGRWAHPYHWAFYQVISL